MTKDLRSWLAGTEVIRNASHALFGVAWPETAFVHVDRASTHLKVARDKHASRFEHWDNGVFLDDSAVERREFFEFDSDYAAGCAKAERGKVHIVLVEVCYGGVGVEEGQPASWIDKQMSCHLVVT